MDDDTRNSAAGPIHAHLAAIEVVGNLEGKNSTKRSEYFVIVSVDNNEVAKSQKKPGQPAPRWEWPEEHRFPFHPSSTLKITIYRGSRIRMNIVKNLVGQYTGTLIESLENDATMDLKDSKTGARITSEIKIRINLSLVAEPEDTIMSLMETVNANVLRQPEDSAVLVLPNTSGFGGLGKAMQLTKDIMDTVGDAHPILKSSWSVMSAVSMAAQQTRTLDHAVRDLAESLRDLLDIAKAYPDLLLIEGTTNIMEEIGHLSLKVSSLIDEYTRSSLIRKTLKFQSSDDFKSRIAQYQRLCEKLKQKFNTRVMLSISQIRQLKPIQNDKLVQGALELLEKYIATSAFHSSAQCIAHPVTILQNIYDWIIQFNRDQRILWLNGSAGSGKSVILQLIAERCVRDSIAVASFFFCYEDSSRNTIQHLAATITFQLIQVIPETSYDILSTIGHHGPSIFNQPLESQLQQLIIQPLLRIPRHRQRQLVVLLDGVNECKDPDDQSNLIKLLGTVSQGRNIPIIFLISSRRETQIEAAFEFDRHQASDLVLTFPIDNSDVEQAPNFIRGFLREKFNNIKETHVHRLLLPTDWPPVSAIEEITLRASGQFIYPLVVMKHLSSPNANPAHQLDIVRSISLRNASLQNPFTHLDALYQHIFSQVEALDMVLDILAYVLITGYRFVHALEEAFLLETGAVEIYLAELTAIIKCEPHIEYHLSEIKFHASLSGFLLDKNRSESYHIDADEYKTKFLCMLLERDPLAQTHALYSVEMQEILRLFAINPLLESRIKTSDRLQLSFTNFTVAFNATASTIPPMIPVIEILRSLKQLDFDDRGQAYYHVLYVFGVWCAKHWGSVCKDLQDLVQQLSPDLHTRISQILVEKS